VGFSASASGGTSPYSYNWDFGDGTSSVSQNPGHVYSTLGNYVATLTVTDNLSASASATVNISVVSSTTAVLGLSAETGAPAPGEGGTTNPAPGNHSFSIGSAVEVDSIPKPDYRFSKWSGDIIEPSMFNLTTTIMLNNNKSLVATFCATCADVNGDLKITPADAQLAFDIFLGKIASPTWCELENADVDCSGTKLVPKITPADAQIIFNTYLKKGTDSGDCSGNSRTAVSSQQNTMFSNASLTIDGSYLTSEGDILIPIIIESPSEIGAFGFDLAFPSDNWTYVGLERTDLTNDYDQLAGNVISYQASGPEQSAAAVPNDQFLRVGGYKTSDYKNASVGVLVTLVFRAKTGFVDPSEISIIAAYDDIQNALIYAGSSIRLRENERRAENRPPADQRKESAIRQRLDL
jgi:PKD repeat protein